MKTKRFKLNALSAVLLCGIAASVSAQEDIATNRLSFSGRLGFNISARFKGNVAVTPGAWSTTRRTPSQEGRPDGDLYNYDDGYILTDFSENAGGMTWYMGYDDVNSQISGNSVLLSRTTALGARSSSRTLDDDPMLGGELTYNRLLKVKGDARIGIEAAVNYLNVSFSANVPVSGTAMQVIDAYNYVPGTTPPDTGTGPYQGSYMGPGFMVFTNVSSSTTNIIGGGAGTDRQRFEADLWGLRLGPYLEVPIGDPMTLSLSAGLAMGLIDADASWRTTVGTTTVSGRGHDWDVLWGAYVSGAMTWHLSEHWSAIGGVQFQTLQNYEQSFGGRKVEVDLSCAFFVTFGISYTF